MENVAGKVCTASRKLPFAMPAYAVAWSGMRSCMADVDEP